MTTMEQRLTNVVKIYKAIHERDISKIIELSTIDNFDENIFIPQAIEMDDEEVMKTVLRIYPTDVERWALPECNQLAFAIDKHYFIAAKCLVDYVMDHCQDKDIVNRIFTTRLKYFNHESCLFMALAEQNVPIVFRMLQLDNLQIDHDLLRISMDFGIELLDLLLKKVKSHVRYDELLSFAVLIDKIEACRYLVEKHGPDPFWVMGIGGDAMLLAMSLGRKDIIAYFKNCEGYSPFMGWCRFTRKRLYYADYAREIEDPDIIALFE